jgi:hypothetical protein
VRTGDKATIAVVVLFLLLFATGIVQSMRSDAYECRAEGGRYFWLGGCAKIEGR